MAELGITLLSEVVYRQLRAAARGKAREVIDLELVRGTQATQLRVQLDVITAQGGTRQQRDLVGAQLYTSCCEALAQATWLTPSRRLELAEEVDENTKCTATLPRKQTSSCDAGGARVIGSIVRG